MAHVEAGSADSFPAAGIVWPYQFDDNGAATPLAPADIAEALLKRPGWVWVHCGLADTRSRHWLTELAPCSSAARHILIDQDEHLRLDVIGSELIGIIPDLQRDFAQPSEDIARLRFVLGDRLLITARRRQLHAVELAHRAIDAGHRFPAPIDLLDNIVDHFADAIARLAETLGDQLDDIEELLMRPDLGHEGQRISRTRFQTVRIHRQLAQMRSLFQRAELRAGNSAPSIAVTVRSLSQKLDALDHELASIYERARLLQDEATAKAGDIMNRRLLTLSVLTACILPPTLVTGFFGMNTKDLPFQQTDGGTWLALLVAIISGAVSYWALRRMRAL